MKITLCGSTSFYKDMDVIQEKLEEKGHTVLHPRTTALLLLQESGGDESHKDNMSPQARQKKNKLIRSHLMAIKDSDAILVVNNTKNNQENYIGGNTFLEMGFALAFNKKIFVLNAIPNNSYTDEITGMLPTVLQGNLDLIESTFTG